jgi:prephenate dehydrogenase
MQQIAIIGMGLIGGSIGLGLRQWSSQNGDALRIVGFDEDLDKQSRARKMGAVDDTEWSLTKAVADADIVIVATPVGAMRQVFEDIGPHLKSNAIVTDTGSTKGDVLTWAEQLPAHVSFIGGHPMAGKSESLAAADAALFQGATWVICPSVRAGEPAVRNVLGIVGALGAESFFVDPVEHDSYVAGISHLPFVAAAALMRATAADSAWRDMKTLSATGFKDTTRLALGNPQMHRDILLTNRTAVARWIDTYVDTLLSVKASLLATDGSTSDQLLEFFSAAQDDRAKVEVQEARVHEQSGGAEGGITRENMSEHVGRMFLGGLGKRRKPPR